MTPTKKQPLFLVTGASCAGKSTACEELFRTEKDCIVLESDLLWNPIFDTPEDGYRAYRRLWMRLCANIAQIGKPVVLCGCAVPEHFDKQPERTLFTDIHFLAVVCSDACLEERMRVGRGVTDENWVKSSLDFNRWLKENAAKTSPPVTLLDTTERTPADAARDILRWITERLPAPESGVRAAFPAAKGR